jgi:hypothetical protein
MAAVKANTGAPVSVSVTAPLNTETGGVAGGVKGVGAVGEPIGDASPPQPIKSAAETSTRIGLSDGMLFQEPKLFIDRVARFQKPSAIAWATFT